MMRAIPTVSPAFDAARGREALAALRRCLRDRLPSRDAGVQPLSTLDAAALRDLGLSRSELDSVDCEAAGAAEPTRRRIAWWPDATPRDGPSRRRAAVPRRGWLLRSAWPVGLVLTAAAAGWQPSTPELDGPAPAASVPEVEADYLPARFAAQEAAAPHGPQPESF